MEILNTLMGCLGHLGGLLQTKLMGLAEITTQSITQIVDILVK